jgi:hypothetical protein
MDKIRYQYVDKDGQRLIEEIHKVVVHRFSMGDVEDPDLYAAQPLWEWQASEAGKFVMEHAVDQPEWHRQADPYNYGYQFIIVAELEKKKLSEFYLRFDKVKI